MGSLPNSSALQKIKNNITVSHISATKENNKIFQQNNSMHFETTTQQNNKNSK